MNNNVVSFEKYMQEGTEPDKHALATEVVSKWVQWKAARSSWEQESAEVRNYIFATDTRSTQNKKLPHKNSTTLPKLTSIRDNLYANYMSALFPNPEWLSWEAAEERTANKDVRRKIEAIMRNRLRTSNFEHTVALLILDYIDYGNCFAFVQHVDERVTAKDGDVKVGYVGPKLFRISPFDVVFDETAISFVKSPKITRSMTTLHSLKKAASTDLTLQYDKEVLDTMTERRATYNNKSQQDAHKIAANSIDGFGGDNSSYLAGNALVELLEFEGDIYDSVTDTLHEDVVITIADRSLVLRNMPRKAWGANGHKHHVGWRIRQDNLYGQGPLNKLCGMQYRIDHLENVRADVFDKVADPMLKIKGEVADFDNKPGERIYIGEEGDVGYIHPDTTFLQADTQIHQLEQRMEEYAGAPREAMGMRSPGEKTAYEVQSLDTRASRVFQNKITQFESMFLEPLVNSMLEIVRDGMSVDGITEPIRTSSGALLFEKLTKEDIVGLGKLYPRGARHFEAQAKLVQNLTTFFNSPLGQDPLIKAHFSGKALASVLDEALGLEQFTLFKEFTAVDEQVELQRLQQVAMEKLETEANTPLDPEEL